MEKKIWGRKSLELKGKWKVIQQLTTDSKPGYLESEWIQGWVQEWVDQWFIKNYHFKSPKQGYFFGLEWITKGFNWLFEHLWKFNENLLWNSMAFHIWPWMVTIKKNVYLNSWVFYIKQMVFSHMMLMCMTSIAKCMWPSNNTTQ